MVHLIKRYPAMILRGPIEDRPTENIVHDTLFIEEHTHEFYFWDAEMGEWMEHHASATNTSMVASMTIYRVGNMVTVRNNVTGLHEFEVDDTTGDASTAFNYAIQNVPTSALAGTATYKGTISIMGGVYNCKTTIDLNAISLGYHGVGLVGEGMGVTRLNFIPTAALTNGIRLRMSRPTIANLRIYGNANVTYLMQIVNDASTPFWNGLIEHVTFDGAQWNTGDVESGLPDYKVGQTGLRNDGALHGAFFWNIDKCFFRGFEYGINWSNVKSTSIELSNCHFTNNRVAIKCSGSQNNFNNCWIQGDLQSGDIGIWFVPGVDGISFGSLENVNNIQFEMPRTADITANYVPGVPDLTAAPDYYGGSVTGLPISGLPKQGAIGVLKDAGTANIRTSNLTSTHSDGGVMVDLVPHANFDTESRSVLRPSQALNTVVGTYFPGAQRLTQESGILKGNVAETVTGTNVGLAAGPARRYTTGTTISTARCIYYTNTGVANGSSVWTRSHNPEISVRFLSGGTNPTANVRQFIGLWQPVPAAGGTFNPLTGDLPDPLTGKSGVGVWLDTAVSPNYRVMHNDGTGGSSITNFDSPQAVSASSALRAMVTHDSDDSSFSVRIGSRVKRVATDIPTAGHFGWLIFFQNTATEDKQLNIYDIEFSPRMLK